MTIKNFFALLPAAVLCISFVSSPGFTQSTCVDCHGYASPGIVNDWKISKHAQIGLGCPTCHGNDHKSSEDVYKVQIP